MHPTYSTVCRTEGDDGRPKEEKLLETSEIPHSSETAGSEFFPLFSLSTFSRPSPCPRTRRKKEPRRDGNNGRMEIEQPKRSACSAETSRNGGLGPLQVPAERQEDGENRHQPGQPVSSPRYCEYERSTVRVVRTGLSHEMLFHAYPSYKNPQAEKPLEAIARCNSHHHHETMREPNRPCRVSLQEYPTEYSGEEECLFLLLLRL